METEEVYMLTLSLWNPHCDAYTAYEYSMLHWKVNMIMKQDREQTFLSDIPEEKSIMSFVQISSVESATINQVCQRSNQVLEERVQPCWVPVS